MQGRALAGSKWLLEERGFASFRCMHCLSNLKFRTRKCMPNPCRVPRPHTKTRYQFKEMER
eukprot:6465660-Amphidinium_carterae.1